MGATQEVLDAIPQRPPFLFVDKVVECNGSKIICEKLLTGNEDFFKGHFPGNPIMPGVLLQESMFQTGAVLMSKMDNGPKGLGVVSRVDNVKFKSFVKPGDTMVMEVELDEQIANAVYMKGKMRVNGKVVLALKFTCAVV